MRARLILFVSAGALLWVGLAFGPGWVGQGRAWLAYLERSGVTYLTRSITGEK